METNFWQIVCVKPNCEKKACERLQKLGIESFVPLQKQLRIWSDRRQWVRKALFCGYVFVRVNQSQRNQVFAEPTVIKYLYIGKEQATISDIELTQIKQLCTSLNPIEVFSFSAKIGAKVRVKSGELIGLIGTIAFINNINYLTIDIISVNYSLQIEINPSLLEYI